MLHEKLIEDVDWKTFDYSSLHVFGCHVYTMYNS